MSPPNDHCTDLHGDRALGKAWELKFCALAADHGLTFTPHQIGRNNNSAVAYYRVNGTTQRLILPDITVWNGPGQHHEIKHKYPTRIGYGLENYRLESLIEFASRIDGLVYYTIHDHSRLGKWAVENEAVDWRTCEVSALLEATRDHTARKRLSPSWVNGAKHNNVPTWYWPVDLFRPLVSIWSVNDAPPLSPPPYEPFGDLFGGSL